MFIGSSRPINRMSRTKQLGRASTARHRRSDRFVIAVGAVLAYALFGR